MDKDKLYPVLSQIAGPEDIKNLNDSQLLELAEEIRHRIIDVVSKTGGHIGASLGVVELTVALHYALSSPEDKIIWDVGHQSYAHKLLTGRFEAFDTLRQYHGISGFPKRTESPHDIAGTGHSGTSISTALGLAVARDKLGQDHEVVAVIGDGSLTTGLAYEGLNQAGHLRSHMIVILNDNVMSISKNVGAMSGYLNRIRLDPGYNRFRENLEERIKQLPGIGEKLLEAGKHIKESLKQLVVAGMLFEELGFKYIGPIDGHDIQALIQSLNMVKAIKEPILLHILTTKGKGYMPAEEKPAEFHGIPPFEKDTGEIIIEDSPPSFTNIFSRTLIKLAESDDKIVAVTAAMPSGTGLDKFAERWPERFFDVGIAEEHAVTFASGLAIAGLKPVVAIYSTFLQRAYDEIIHDVCLQKLPVVFAIDRGGLVGEDGATHHGVFDLAYLRHIPNMVIMAPKDENELQHMLATAFKLSRPIALRYPRGYGLGVHMDSELCPMEIGKAELIQEGRELMFCAIGKMVDYAKAATTELAKQKLTSTVINFRFVKPIDKEMITALAPCHDLLITLEDNCLTGGFGDAVLEVLSEKNICMPSLRLGIPDRFINHGSQAELFEEVGLSVDKIVEAIKKRLREACPQHEPKKPSR